MESIFDSYCQTILTSAQAITHDGYATIAKHLTHIAEIEVYGAFYGDLFGVVCVGNRFAVSNRNNRRAFEWNAWMNIGCALR